MFKNVFMTALLAVIAVGGTFNSVAAQETDDYPEVIVLQPGVWNRVTWEGPRVGMRGALRVAPEVQYAWGWDADKRAWQFATREGFATEGAWLLPGMTVYLWIAGGETAEWVQHPYVPPVVTFDDEITENVRKMARAEIERATDLFAMRLGIRVSGLTIHYPYPRKCRQASRDTILVNHFENGHNCFAHEYGHAMETQLTTRITPDGVFSVAWLSEWMVEGIANYFENHVYDDWDVEFPSYEAFRKHIETKLRDPNDPWPEEWDPDLLREPTRSLSEMAIVHLVDLIGEDAFLTGLGRHIRLFDEDGNFSTERFNNARALWFEVAFGMTLDEFYDSFAAFRASVGEPWGTISGRLIDERGQPISGAYMALFPWLEDVPWSWMKSDLTDEDGSFRITILHGAIDHPLGYRVESGDHRAVCVVRDNDHEDIENVVFDTSLPSVRVGGKGANVDGLPDCKELVEE
ncbi:MAG: carboxypeptidase regulatory-like domain-containing protein [Dehalococcoidia bacterium]|nr:carboxypeptidase regulatory-like domain-containing protein [Dehalococcoidia bacterium]MYA52947.1 carboxypeptidase regulatory-like domain-containing protein [Dehalococcoidia bacterium]